MAILCTFAVAVFWCSDRACIEACKVTFLSLARVRRRKREKKKKTIPRTLPQRYIVTASLLECVQPRQNLSNLIFVFQWLQTIPLVFIYCLFYPSSANAIDAVLSIAWHRRPHTTEHVQKKTDEKKRQQIFLCNFNIICQWRPSHSTYKYK